MTSRIQTLVKAKVAQPPRWLPDNMHYEVQMGSVAYGVAGESSDVDVYGFCIPPKELIFPHLAGEIPGFGRQLKRFEQYQEHHLEHNGMEYDFSVYSIVKFFHLAMENNPNMVDALFVPQRCVLFCSPVAQQVRDARQLFLHKGAYHKLRGYAYAQLHKIGSKANASNPKRQESIDLYGYDVKFAYHVVRLVLQCEQILVEHDLDLERNRELLKAIRRGEWTEQRLRDWFSEKERHLENLYASSTLRHSPDEDALKDLLLDCLEQHYGSLEKAVVRQGAIERLVSELEQTISKYK